MKFATLAIIAAIAALAPSTATATSEVEANATASALTTESKASILRGVGGSLVWTWNGQDIVDGRRCGYMSGSGVPYQVFNEQCATWGTNCYAISDEYRCMNSNLRSFVADCDNCLFCGGWSCIIASSTQ